MSVLEVGGGLGELQVALLESGLASDVINIELATNWEASASELLAERKLSDRARRLQGDFVEVASKLPMVDVVIMHRVVCCYRDWSRLLTEACAKTRRLLVLTFPNRRAGPLIAVENLYHRVRRRQFRAFVHSPAEMAALVVGSGFRIDYVHKTGFWRTVIWNRQQSEG